jgi:hypothetical protein
MRLARAVAAAVRVDDDGPDQRDGVIDEMGGQGDARGGEWRVTSGEPGRTASDYM